MTTSGSLIIRAGVRAAAHIREHGLRPQDIDLLPGAAGGPKALGIQGLDIALFGDWLQREKKVRHLIGSSIGSWRFACAAQRNPVVALKEFAHLYTEQRYPPGASAALITHSCRQLLRDLFEQHGEESLQHPHYRLNILSVRGRGLLRRENRATPSAFLLARTIFSDPRDTFPLLPIADAFHTQVVALNAGNLQAALLASAAIPIVIEGVRDIPGAAPGTYWDGGIIDYHLHLPYQCSKGLVLYPHFADKIIPGWLDKPLPWRRVRGAWLENVVLVSPSKEYLASLPYGKLPDRGDFKKFGADHSSRIRYWQQTIAESERLGAEFLQMTESGRIAERLLPLWKL
jgi:hypothetical protein